MMMNKPIITLHPMNSTNLINNFTPAQKSFYNSTLLVQDQALPCDSLMKLEVVQFAKTPEATYHNPDSTLC